MVEKWVGGVFSSERKRSVQQGENEEECMAGRERGGVYSRERTRRSVQ